MPQIRLKTNSPDYLDPGQTPQGSSRPRCCDMPGCQKPGEHRAPRDRSLSSHYWFCLDHVQDYNAAWNFFAGMADRDIENHIVASFYGDRPTWRADAYRGLEAELWRKIEAMRFFRDEEPGPEQANPNARSTGNPELDALAVLGLEAPIDFAAIKKRYRTLVKQYHPDHQGGDASKEDLLKKINMAYTILKVSFRG